MKMSTRGRYSLRLMIDLACNFEKDRVAFVKLKDIAARQGISRDYLVILIHMLKNAGLVRSARGKDGGYVLSRPPTEISALEIVESTIGEISILDCIEDIEVCGRTKNCRARKVWSGLNKTIRDELGAITLDQLT